MDEEGKRLRPVLVGLGALVAATALVGAVISLVALGLANVTGMSGGESVAVASSAEPTLYVPKPSPTPTSSPSKPSSPPSPGTTSPSPSQTTQEAQQRPITLTARPKNVAVSERITLDGTYREANGTTLRVQRLEGRGWTDFPVTATVNGGVFSTYIFSGQVGPNRIRVLDASTGRRSGTVVVNIG